MHVTFFIEGVGRALFDTMKGVDLARLQRARAELARAGVIIDAEANTEELDLIAKADDALADVVVKVHAAQAALARALLRAEKRKTEFKT